MKTTTQTVCGRCSGTGTYRGAGWTGTCYGCDGCGVATAAAGNRAAADLYSAACRACRAGVAGAREYYRANRTSPAAVDALYYALLDADMTREAAALYAHTAAR